MQQYRVDIIGAGLAGSEAALQLARRGVYVRLFEMRPSRQTAVHKSARCAELVCSNSLKSTNPNSAAGMLKSELDALQSPLLACARENQVPAGGALAVDRERFSVAVTALIDAEPCIQRIGAEVVGLEASGAVRVAGGARFAADSAGLAADSAGHAADSASATYEPADAVIFATGPLTSDALAAFMQELTGAESLSFYDAAAPIIMADSLDRSRVFSQSRYESGGGDYLNAPFTKDEYEAFIAELIAAKRVVAREFETKELFQACQPIEEIARSGIDAPRFGPLKPVGLIDPDTGHRPWAVVQLRAEDAQGQSYNLVGFQTNLTFPEQQRVFRMIPGLENAEFARFGVMHRNTFIDAPRLLDSALRLQPAIEKIAPPVFVAGQLGGTEGYCEAIASGSLAALGALADARNGSLLPLPEQTAFGALISYATNPNTQNYQPMHVNFGIMPPLPQKIRNKKERYAAYAARGARAMEGYMQSLAQEGLA